jgi:hypothetical protein
MLTIVASKNADFRIATGLDLKKLHYSTAATIG